MYPGTTTTTARVVFAVARLTSSLASGATIICTFNAATSSGWIAIASKITNVKPTGTLVDVHPVNTTQTGPAWASSPSGVLAQANEILLAAVNNVSGSVANNTPEASWTDWYDDGHHALQYKKTSTTDSDTATGSQLAGTLFAGLISLRGV